MAKGEYAIQISGKVQQAIDALQDVQKELKGVGGAVKKSKAGVKGLSVEFLAFGTALVGTATSIAFIGAAVEKAMFKSSTAINRAGADADKLAGKLQAAGRSAAELLPVGAAFAQIGFAGKDLAEVSEIVHQFGRVTGMASKEASAMLSQMAAKAGYDTVPEMRKLASVLDATTKMFPSFSKGAHAAALALGSTASEAEVFPASILSASVAFQRAGVSAGDAQQAIKSLLKNMLHGPVQFASFATALGLPMDRFDEFAGMKPEAAFQGIFDVMKEGGVVTRRNVPILMSLLGVGEETAHAMVKMARASGDANEIFSTLGKEFEKGTYLQKDFNKWTKTLYGAIDQLWQSISGVAEKAAPPFAWALTEIVRALTAVVGVVRDLPGWMISVGVAIAGVTGAVMLLSKFLMTSFVGSVLGSAKAMTQFVFTMLAGDAAAKAQAISMMGLHFAKLKDAGVTLLIIGRNLTMIAGYVIMSPLLLLMKIKTLALAAANAVLGTSIGKVGLAMIKFAGKAVVAMVTGLGTMTAAAWTFVTTAVPAMVSGLGAIAVAAWAAIAPLLPFIAIGALIVAAVLAVGYAIYKVVQIISENWVPIWGAITAGLAATWNGLKVVSSAFMELGSLVGGVIVGVFQSYWNILTSVWGVITNVSDAIWGGLIGGLKAVWGWVASTGESIAAPFVYLRDVIKEIKDSIGGFVGRLFGLSNVKESVAEVMPALNKMEGAFTGIGKAAGKVGLESHIPEDIRVRITNGEGGKGGGRTGGLSSDLDGKQAYGGPAGSGPTGGISTPPANLGVAGAGEGTAASTRVVIPVTVMLNDEVLARAMTEHEINTGRERYMNSSTEAYRGTGR